MTDSYGYGIFCPAGFMQKSPYLPSYQWFGGLA